MPTNGDLVRTTGLCSVCDFQFRDEVVARFPSPSMPGGWAYIELRHLEADEISALRPVDDSRLDRAQPAKPARDAE
jgi:hypothetical protein